jgi:hypothetical protein
VAVVAGAGAILLVKDAIRPLTGDLTLMLVLALLLSLVAAARMLLDGQRRVAPVALGLVVGLLAAALTFSGEVSVLTTGISTAPVRLYRDLVTTVRPSSEARAVEKGQFDWSHFTQFPAELALARAIAPLVRGSSSNLYVLGDDPVEYVLLNQQPPWEINVYNTSPIRDQHHVIAWIEDHKPAVAILDLPDGQTFDGVPDDVRIPLVYQQIVGAYEPAKSVDGYDVLLRRRPREKPAATFWIDQLGSVLDLGAIPDVESPILPATRGSERTPVLQVRARTTAPRGEVSVPISFGGNVVTVEFQATPGRRSYDIPIDRLWPWALSHHVKLGGAPSTGWSATIVSGSMPTSRLY